MNERIRRCVASALDLSLDEVTENTSREDIEQWDSIGAIRVVICLEEEFGVSIAPEVARRMTGCREIVAELGKLGVTVP